MKPRLLDAAGQSLLEFSLVLPLILMLALGVVEVGYALLDQHVVTKLTREGSNLISRDSTIEAAERALKSMSSRPVNFDTSSKVIFSVIRNGATTGTPNFGHNILYQRRESGGLTGVSSVLRTGGGSYRGAPDYEAIAADTDTRLRIINLPTNITVSPGGFVYVTEVFTRHELLTPLHRFGVALPETLYSIAYF